MRGGAPPGFSASDAAFTGFRVVAARPWIVLVWAAAWFAFQVGTTAFGIVSGREAFARWLDVLIAPGAADQATLLTLWRSVAPTVAALAVAELVYYAIAWAAMNRAVFHPEQRRFAYVRLAGDELRQLGLFALIVALFLALCIAASFVASIVVVFLSLVTGAAGAAGLALEVMIGGLIVAALFFAVRLSLASPLTFATQRIDLLGAWRLTRLRFWPLAGTYLIAIALAVVVVALTSAIAIAGVTLVGGVGAPGELLQPPATLPALFSPARLLYVAVDSVGWGLSGPVLMTPPATIYRAITGRPAGTR